MLKLEIGKTYATRGGDSVKITGKKKTIFIGKMGKYERCYFGTGVHALGDTEYDLVSEQMVIEKVEPVFQGCSIEAGKYYLSRKGEEYGPMIENIDGTFSTPIGMFKWDEFGRHLDRPGQYRVDKAHDLINASVDGRDTGEQVPDPDYAPLRDAFDAAYQQATTGKGKERHANGLPWTDQPIFNLAHTHGHGFLSGQAAKKLEEALGMWNRGEYDKARHEILGTIVYTAALWVFWNGTKWK